MANSFSDSQLVWTEGEKEILLKTPIATVCQTPATASDGQNTITFQLIQGTGLP